MNKQRHRKIEQLFTDRGANKTTENPACRASVNARLSVTICKMLEHPLLAVPHVSGIVCTVVQLYQATTATYSDWKGKLYAWIAFFLSNEGIEIQLKGLFVTGGPRRILEEENYKPLSMVFPMLVGFIDWCTAWMEGDLLTKVHVLYSRLMLSLMTHKGCDWRNDKQLL